MPPPRKLRRILRIIAWNMLFTMVGLLLVGGGAEVYFRITRPFMASSYPTVFHPAAGQILEPGAVVRWTNRLDFWQATQVNSLGFLDREPVVPERVAASCHIAVIGDSFVEGREVPVDDKVQVQLERLATERLPHLNVVASGFGFGGTGQIAQLGYYDEFARPLVPKMVVLVFVPNDFIDNFPLGVFVRNGIDPQHNPHITAVLELDGNMELRPPSADWRDFMLQVEAEQDPWYRRFVSNVGSRLYMYKWAYAKLRAQTIGQKLANRNNAHSKLLAQRPGYSHLMADWTYVSPDTSSFSDMIASDDLSAFYDTALSYTAFGLDAFQERAERDGFSLVILATHLTRFFGDGVFNRVSEMAGERGIPVIDQARYARRQGIGLQELHWGHDYHWRPEGHRYAAEALLEYLGRNQEVCGSAP